MALRALRHHQRKNIFNICKSGKSADFPDLLFSRKKLLLVQRAVAWDRLKGFYKILLRRVCSLLRAKREPERTAVPAGHESPSGAFKPQTGLRSKCCVFSTARSQRFQRAGSMKKGLLALNNPKAVRLHTKNSSRCAKGFFVFRRFRVAYATSCTGKFVLYLLRG